jgi:hypothetical protein
MDTGISYAGGSPTFDESAGGAVAPPQKKPLALPPGGIGLASGPPAMASASSATAPGSSPSGGVGLAPMTPAITPPASTIPTPTVAPPASPVDRVKLATDVFNNSAASTQGAYDAASRDNIHNSAALGQIASGGLRTREGNLQLARSRDLDQMRKDLVNKATEGSIADATTAYQQALASSQQGLAEKVAGGNLDVAKGSLDLEKEKAATAASQGQQQIDLAKTGQAQGYELSKDQLDLQSKLGLGNLSVEQQRASIAKQEADANAAYQAGTLTLAQKNQMLAELKQAADIADQQGRLDLAKTGQAADIENQQGQLQLAKDSLAQAGKNFGLSLAQQKELATLVDKTQNRQLDISGAQGQNALLLELARIMGGPTGNVSPDFLMTVAKALGVAMPATGGGTTGAGGTGTSGGSGGGGAGGSGGTGGGNTQIVQAQ